MAIIDHCTWSQRDVVLAFSAAGRSTLSCCTCPQQLGPREKTAPQVLGVSHARYSKVGSVSVDFAIESLQQAVDHDESEWLQVDSPPSTWTGKKGPLREFRARLAHPDDRYQHMYNGFIFDAPQDDDNGPAYLVTRGRRVGVFRTW